MSLPIVQLQNVSKRFSNGVEALKNISLSVQKGEIFGILGKSGAGKSTLIRLLNAMEKPTTGSVFLNNQDLGLLKSFELAHLRHSIAMISQSYNLVTTSTVLQNVTLPLTLLGRKEGAKEKARKYLRIVGLQDKEHSYPSQLSGGQKQRVAIARALALQPSLLLSDESTSALDPQTKTSILQLLKKINRELGITIILITHELEVVQAICSKGAVMDEGCIIEQGNIESLFIHPKADLTRAFLSTHFKEKLDINVLSGKKGKLIRLGYLGNCVSEPALAFITKHFAVIPNILSGQITHLGDIPYGRLTVMIEGEEAEVEKAIAYFGSNNIDVEEVAYDQSAC